MFNTILTLVATRKDYLYKVGVPCSRVVSRSRTSTSIVPKGRSTSPGPLGHLAALSSRTPGRNGILIC